MRRLVPALAATSLLVLAMASCRSDAPSSGGLNPDEALVPDSTLPPPGSCDPLDQQIPAPSVVVDGTATEATFGVGAYQCGTITGNGYVVNNFNPVLIDVPAPAVVTVEINSDAVVAISTINGVAFAQSGDGEWTSSAPLGGCDRVTIVLTSPSGGSNATFGADIRTGGEATACPQRDLEDVGDAGAIDTTPSPSVSDDTIVPPILTYEPDFSIPPVLVTLPPDTTGG